MTLAEQIRALQLGLPVGGTAHAALDRAAALADQHQADADALVAAAYEAAGVRARHLWHDSQDAEEVEIGINNLTNAHARAALDRIKEEAHRAGMREAAGICERIRIAIANGPMPEGARFDYEQAILAAAEKEAGNG